MKKIFFILALSLIFFSCRREKTIELDDAVPLSLAPDVFWALVIDPYAAFRENPSWESSVAGHCRKSDIFQVIGKSISNDGIWYKFESGWLPESAVAVYTNRYKAITAKNGLK